jgi:hypothetical protein
MRRRPLIGLGRAVRFISGIVVFTAAAAMSVATASAPGLASTGMGVSNGGWGNAFEVPGISPLNTGGLSSVTVISCASPGNCSAGGYYFPGPQDQEVFVVGETNGAWGKAEQVPGTATLNAGTNAQLYAMSCASPGNCSAGGDYNDGSNWQAFVVDETKGTWGNAEEVPGTGALNKQQMGAQVDAISCSSAGNCSAGGFYTDNSQDTHAFVVTERNGSWGKAQQLTGAGLGSSVAGLSCTSAGDCVAVGQNGTPFIATQAGGTWGAVIAVPGMAGLDTGGTGNLGAVSCASAGNCSAGGQYNLSSGTGAFVLSEKKGTWGNAQPVGASLNAGKFALVSSISCASAGNCGAGGVYADKTDTLQAFVVNETAGTWGSAEEVPGTAKLNASVGNMVGAAVNEISCPSAGNCGAAGYYAVTVGQTGAFVATETNGIWGSAEQPPGLAVLNTGGSLGASAAALSCPSAGNCSAGGSYTAKKNSAQQPFLIDQASVSPTSTGLTLSPPRVTYGHEQAERLSVTVSAHPGSTPTGTVTVGAPRTTLCTIKISAGKGACSLTAAKLAAGSYKLTASYAGAPGFRSSASAAKILTVTRATTVTTLKLSAPKVTYGKEGTEHLSVTVAPASAHGSVTVRTVVKHGTGTTVCVIKPKNGKGACTLPARKLPVGSYELAATYPGNSDYTASTSTKHALNVA